MKQRWQPKGRSKTILYQRDTTKPLEFQKAAGRQQLETFAEQTELDEEPWDTMKTETGGQRQLYKPANVEGSGDSLFHMLIFAKEGILEEWSTSLFTGKNAYFI